MKLVTNNAAPKLSSLEAIEQARQHLAEARSFEDVLEIGDKAAAAEAYLERKAKGTLAHAEAWALTQDAHRRFGELSRELPKAAPGRKRKVAGGDGEEIVSRDAQIAAKPKRAVLGGMGVSSKAASEAERMANLADREYTARREAGKLAITTGSRPKPITASSSSPDYDGDECSTPGEWVERVRVVLGGRIAFDPFSNEYAQNVIRADRFYTKRDSSLVAGVSWEHETAFIQPPYSATLVRLGTEKFLNEWAQDHIGAAIVLVNASVETEWFQSLIDACTLMHLPRKRIQFEYKGEPIAGSNRYAQAFFYFGKQDRAFHTEFHRHGAVLAPVRGFF